jgi:hypothetical protein
MVTAVGTVLFVVVPSPSLPKILLPQQYALPLLESAQVCEVLADIDENVTPAGMVTAVGVVLSEVVPLPSCPEELNPQQ